MAFAGHCGLDISLDALPKDGASILFNEELGALIQIRTKDKDRVFSIFDHFGLKNEVYEIGHPILDPMISFTKDHHILLSEDWSYYRKLWAQTTHHMQMLRDNPKTAQEELLTKINFQDPGLFCKQTFEIKKPKDSVFQPKIAILREQGTNGHVEMAAAFHRAGFT